MDRDEFIATVRILLSDISADFKRGDGVVPKTRAAREQRCLKRIFKAANVEISDAELNDILFF